jgi:hypothetical protein
MVNSLTSQTKKKLVGTCRAFHSSREQGKLPVQLLFIPCYFVFKNKNVKVKVKYGFALHTGLSFAL